MTFYWGFGDFFRIMGHTVQYSYTTVCVALNIYKNLF